MLIKSFDIKERRDFRVHHCYPDIVFQRSHRVIHKHAESLGMEAIYASAMLFSQFLLENKIEDPDYIGYEIDDLQEELPSMTDLLLLLTVTYLRLCCSSKEAALSKAIAQGVETYCFSTPLFAAQLQEMPDVKELFSLSFGQKIDLPPPQHGQPTTITYYTVNGDFVKEKIVEHQTNGVAAGGTGIQVNK